MPTFHRSSGKDDGRSVRTRSLSTSIATGEMPSNSDVLGIRFAGVVPVVGVNVSSGSVSGPASTATVHGVRESIRLRALGTSLQAGRIEKIPRGNGRIRGSGHEISPVGEELCGGGGGSPIAKPSRHDNARRTVLRGSSCENTPVRPHYTGNGTATGCTPFRVWQNSDDVRSRWAVGASPERPNRWG